MKMNLSDHRKVLLRKKKSATETETNSVSRVEKRQREITSVANTPTIQPPKELFERFPSIDENGTPTRTDAENGSPYSSSLKKKLNNTTTPTSMIRSSQAEKTVLPRLTTGSGDSLALQQINVNPRVSPSRPAVSLSLNKTSTPSSKIRSSQEKKTVLPTLTGSSNSLALQQTNVSPRVSPSRPVFLSLTEMTNRTVEEITATSQAGSTSSFTTTTTTTLPQQRLSPPFMPFSTAPSSQQKPPPPVPERDNRPGFLNDAVSERDNPPGFVNDRRVNGVGCYIHVIVHLLFLFFKKKLPVKSPMCDQCKSNSCPHSKFVKIMQILFEQMRTSATAISVQPLYDYITGPLAWFKKNKHEDACEFLTRTLALLGEFGISLSELEYTTDTIRKCLTCNQETGSSVKDQVFSIPISVTVSFAQWQGKKKKTMVFTVAEGQAQLFDVGQEIDFQEKISMYSKATPLARFYGKYEIVAKTSTSLECKFLDSIPNLDNENLDDMLETVETGKSIRGIISSTSFSASFERVSKTESFTEENKPFCDDCKKQCGATKTTLMNTFPNNLLLQLKRFYTAGDKRLNNYWEGKVDTNSLRVPDTLSIETCLSVALTSSLQDSNISTDKHLTLVIEHSGSLHNGHYIIYIRDAYGQWREFNDDLVILRDRIYVEKRQAYIALYSTPVDDLPPPPVAAVVNTTPVAVPTPTSTEPDTRFGKLVFATKGVDVESFIGQGNIYYFQENGQLVIEPESENKQESLKQREKFSTAYVVDTKKETLTVFTGEEAQNITMECEGGRSLISGYFRNSYIEAVFAYGPRTFPRHFSTNEYYPIAVLVPVDKVPEEKEDKRKKKKKKKKQSSHFQPAWNNLNGMQLLVCKVNGEYEPGGSPLMLLTNMSSDNQKRLSQIKIGNFLLNPNKKDNKHSRARYLGVEKDTQELLSLIMVKGKPFVVMPLYPSDIALEYARLTTNLPPPVSHKRIHANLKDQLIAHQNEPWTDTDTDTKVVSILETNKRLSEIVRYALDERLKSLNQNLDECTYEKVFSILYAVVAGIYNLNPAPYYHTSTSSKSDLRFALDEDFNGLTVSVITTNFSRNFNDIIAFIDTRNLAKFPKYSCVIPNTDALDKAPKQFAKLNKGLTVLVGDAFKGHLHIPSGNVIHIAVMTNLKPIKKKKSETLSPGATKKDAEETFLKLLVEYALTVTKLQLAYLKSTPLASRVDILGGFNIKNDDIHDSSISVLDKFKQLNSHQVLKKLVILTQVWEKNRGRDGGVHFCDFLAYFEIFKVSLEFIAQLLGVNKIKCLEERAFSFHVGLFSYGGKVYNGDTEFRDTLPEAIFRYKELVKEKRERNAFALDWLATVDEFSLQCGGPRTAEVFYTQSMTVCPKDPGLVVLIRFLDNLLTKVIDYDALLMESHPFHTGLEGVAKMAYKGWLEYVQVYFKYLQAPYGRQVTFGNEIWKQYFAPINQVAPNMARIIKGLHVVGHELNDRIGGILPNMPTRIEICLSRLLHPNHLPHQTHLSSIYADGVDGVLAFLDEKFQEVMAGMEVDTAPLSIGYGAMYAAVLRSFAEPFARKTSVNSESDNIYHLLEVSKAADVTKHGLRQIVFGFFRGNDWVTDQQAQDSGITTADILARDLLEELFPRPLNTSSSSFFGDSCEQKEWDKHGPLFWALKYGEGKTTPTIPSSSQPFMILSLIELLKYCVGNSSNNAATLSVPIMIEFIERRNKEEINSTRANEEALEKEMLKFVDSLKAIAEHEAQLIDKKNHEDFEKAEKQNQKQIERKLFGEMDEDEEEEEDDDDDEEEEEEDDDEKHHRRNREREKNRSEVTTRQQFRANAATASIRPSSVPTPSLVTVLAPTSLSTTPNASSSHSLQSISDKTTLGALATARLSVPSSASPASIPSTLVSKDSFKFRLKQKLSNGDFFTSLSGRDEITIRKNKGESDKDYCHRLYGFKCEQSHHRWKENHHVLYNSWKEGIILSNLEGKMVLVKDDHHKQTFAATSDDKSGKNTHDSCMCGSLTGLWTTGDKSGDIVYSVGFEDGTVEMIDGIKLSPRPNQINETTFDLSSLRKKRSQ
jgi:hypothetical protein